MLAGLIKYCESHIASLFIFIYSTIISLLCRFSILMARHIFCNCNICAQIQLFKLTILFVLYHTEPLINAQIIKDYVATDYVSIPRRQDSISTSPPNRSAPIGIPGMD